MHQFFSSPVGLLVALVPPMTSMCHTQSLLSSNQGLVSQLRLAIKPLLIDFRDLWPYSLSKHSTRTEACPKKRNIRNSLPRGEGVPASSFETSSILRGLCMNLSKCKRNRGPPPWTNQPHLSWAGDFPGLHPPPSLKEGQNDKHLLMLQYFFTLCFGHFWCGITCGKRELMSRCIFLRHMLPFLLFASQCT